ncbi:bifunctional diaminohydroxyphosphoribosylaminopyrimidine deaminase/5-amino-6-(5-phosphoribosylamino)uracil reductase RibD [Agitococcus lubricus]|uniref:Riboflavin biosynthesis protein RibD n=1 Tax=Agitococcus lubricus TaxID=1077255 RepID=A0A2T5IUN7_9GAMM|nr:bifunctional diaminohydroxyphosphoribosylaminopyrimidine deaminase/5-amino-6-(5-phosphoribosylamino)uracil reductase RibD [Agitococcus lubricus]PTQ87533.1 diaminohydroxyphosphoribosylaminopyrimidine deaminase [Agitococcus lubricus]
MNDRQYMARAIQLAQEGIYTTQPNPRVGCVVVNDGIIVGEGFHARAGFGHAEVHALQQAGSLAHGATAYVTLEPCAHYGRTPPCANALIAAGVARVVMASLDSNPLVAGKGQAMLEAQGIVTSVGVLEDEAKALNKGFFRRMQGGLPWVRLKMAGSLDGRTAMASGESKWITGVDARRDVQKLRAQSGAIITGIGTVLADNPSLNVRPQEWLDWHYGEPVQPLRVVLDRELRMPLEAQLLNQTGVIIVTQQTAQHCNVQALNAKGAEIWHLSDTQHLETVLAKLAERGINEVLVEAGATLAGAFVRANLVDECIFYLAPTLLGSDARPLLTLAFTDMAQQRRLVYQDMRMIGQDVRIVARLSV